MGPVAGLLCCRNRGPWALAKVTGTRDDGRRAGWEETEN